MPSQKRKPRDGDKTVTARKRPRVPNLHSAAPKACAHALSQIDGLRKGVFPTFESTLELLKFAIEACRPGVSVLAKNWLSEYQHLHWEGLGYSDASNYFHVLAAELLVSSPAPSDHIKAVSISFIAYRASQTELLGNLEKDCASLLKAAEGVDANFLERFRLAWSDCQRRYTALIETLQMLAGLCTLAEKLYGECEPSTYTEEVDEAVAEGRPARVIASILESSLVPRSKELARPMIAGMTTRGSKPATIELEDLFKYTPIGQKERTDLHFFKEAVDMANIRANKLEELSKNGVEDEDEEPDFAACARWLYEILRRATTLIKMVEDLEQDIENMNRQADTDKHDMYMVAARTYKLLCAKLS